MAAILRRDTHITRELGIPLTSSFRLREDVNSLSLFYMAACDLIFFCYCNIKNNQLEGIPRTQRPYWEGIPISLGIWVSLSFTRVQIDKKHFHQHDLSL